MRNAELTPGHLVLGNSEFHDPLQIWQWVPRHSAFAWRARGDLNTRHTAPEAVALSGLSYRRKPFTPHPSTIAPPVLRCNALIPTHSIGMVGVRGFEPPTPCSQSRCATRLRHTPKRSLDCATRVTASG